MILPYIWRKNPHIIVLRAESGKLSQLFSDPGFFSMKINTIIPNMEKKDDFSCNRGLSGLSSFLKPFGFTLRLFHRIILVLALTCDEVGVYLFSATSYTRLLMTRLIYRSGMELITYSRLNIRISILGNAIFCQRGEGNNKNCEETNCTNFTHLAVKANVVASIQNRAMNALV